MSEPMKQHYVPQTYLRRFSVAFKKIHKIYTLHKDKREIYFTGIRDTAAERHFYTVESSEDKYQWEKTYANEVEPILDEVLTEIITKSNNVLLRNRTPIIKDELKYKLCISIVFQLLRGKHSRDLQHKVYSDSAPSIIEKLRKLDIVFDDSKERIIDDFLEGKKYFKDISFDAAFNLDEIEKYTNILFKKSFVLYKICGDADFITSDNPVMFMDSITLDVKPFRNGLLNNRTIVFFPLSPKLMIAIYSPDYFFGELSQYDGKILYIDAIKEKSFIKNINTKQSQHSYNQIYARNERDLKDYL